MGPGTGATSAQTWGPSGGPRVERQAFEETDRRQAAGASGAIVPKRVRRFWTDAGRGVPGRSTRDSGEQRNAAQVAHGSRELESEAAVCEVRACMASAAQLPGRV